MSELSGYVDGSGVFVEESSKKKKNTMDFLKALAILKVNPRELKKKILEVGCEEAKEMLGEAVGEQTRAFRKNGNILQIKGFEETQDVSLFHEAYQYLVTECIEKKDVKNLTDVIEGRYVSAAKLQARKAEKDFNMELKQVADLTETEKLLENTEELIGLKPKGSVKSKKQTRGLIDEITPKVESMSLKDKKSSSRDNKSSKGYNQAKETTKKKGSMKKKK